MNRLERFNNRHTGERVVVVANGPSLNNMDLCFLRHETAIGMNKIFLGLNKFRFYPKYYVAINRKVIEQSINNIKSLNCNKFISMRGSELLPEDALTYHLETQNPPARFSKDITRGIHEGWTVTYAAIQVAYFLGFSEVVIIGMDHRYQFTGQPNEARRLDGPDPNHFCPEYFGGGQNWDNPDLKNSEESYRIARTEFENDGRRILDATLYGSCEIFEKIHYKDYFGLR
nr:6-hydroxymethylpterin diphosphokinase MptE-like protein [uncultured Desulfobulbus sp.]